MMVPTIHNMTSSRNSLVYAAKAGQATVTVQGPVLQTFMAVIFTVSL
jgi:hypothetical protein